MENDLIIVPDTINDISFTHLNIENDQDNVTVLLKKRDEVGNLNEKISNNIVAELPIDSQPIPSINKHVDASNNTIDRPIPAFINAYSTSEQKIKKDDFIIFDITNSLYGNCAHTPKTSEIYIWRTGYYSVYTSIYHMEACQFSLLKNSQFIAPVSTIGSNYGSPQNSNYFIIQLTDSDMVTPTTLSTTGVACKLQIINNSKTTYMPYTTLMGAYSSGNVLPQITASIIIQSII
jgi:hypothetical protein